jgi:hypothetical protein
MGDDWWVLRLHVKTLVEPQVGVDTMVSCMAQVYATARVRVSIVSIGPLILPELLDVQVGACDGTMTPDLDKLYAYRQPALPSEPVAYVVRSLNPPTDGCSTHPTNVPAIVISQLATEWTLAHEIGHLLGLSHVDDDHNLMTGDGTENIINPPPILTPEQADQMHASPFVQGMSDIVTTVQTLLSKHTPYDQKLRELPPTGDAALEEIANGTDVAAASRAVYLAGISGKKRGVALAQSKLNDSRIHVRVAAAAALKTRNPIPSVVTSLAVNPSRRVKPRGGEKARKRRVPTRPASQ